MTSIRKSLGTGIFYTALAKYSGIFISIVVGAILARLLSPEEFGIVALVIVFVNFFNLLSDFGIGPAVVQNQTLTKNDIQSIFSFSIIIGFAMSLLFYMLSPLIARFYNNQELITISKLLSFSILFNSLQIVPKALIRKDLKFKQIGIITVVIQLVSGISAIILAFKGFSYYALVIQSIISGFLSLLIFYRLAPLKISLRIKSYGYKKILKFSTYQFIFNIINYFSRNADNILIGKFLGSSALGYYNKSYQLMMMPVSNLTNVITPVLMPVLSKYQDDKEIVFSSYLKVVKILATIGFPLSVFLFFSAYEIINVLYGSQWEQSIPVFKLLSLTVGFQMILSSSGSIFQTVNRTDLMFTSGLFGTIVLVGAVIYGILVGNSIITVGYGVIFGYTIYFFITFYFLINKALKIKSFQFYKILIPPILISLVMVIIFFQVDCHIYLENIILFLLLKTIIAIVSVGLCFLCWKENRKNVKNQFFRFWRRSLKNRKLKK